MGSHHATIFTMRLGTTMTFLGAAPARARPSQAPHHAFIRERGGFHRLVIGTDRHRDFTAALAIHLHRDGDGVAFEQSRIMLWPWRGGSQRLMPQRLPAFFRQ